MIIISNPTAIANEIDIIHSLFEEGLELFHIRKPDFSEAKMKAFILAIGLDYNDKLVLHSHHHLAEDFGITRLHLSERKRKDISTKKLYEYNERRIRLSTSTHSIEDFNHLRLFFQYAFLSPVYPSISKENYHPKVDLFSEIKKRTNFNTQLVALGGIEFGNIKKIVESGFDQVALLGTIWNSNNPIENFKSCQQIVLSL
ncbi:MAG: thiamine phosphate synthase [Bacteroidota bacterium]